jgi:hypothetical protein
MSRNKMSACVLPSNSSLPEENCSITAEGSIFLTFSSSSSSINVSSSQMATQMASFVIRAPVYFLPIKSSIGTISFM